MNLKLGIVGLPNVGKSTLFNALTKTQSASAENFPFCTIDPNIGRVDVPDTRLKSLADIINPQKIVPSVIEFVDIAGLVEGASQGEGLGNQFLSHIRECNAIAHVLRDFEDSNIHHVADAINPGNDLSVILTELMLADLESVIKQQSKSEKKARSGDKEEKAKWELGKKLQEVLSENKMITEMTLNDTETTILKSFNLLTAKPFFIVVNVAETEIGNFNPEKFREKLQQVSSIAPMIPHIKIVPICAEMEAQMSDMTEEETQSLLSDMGVSDTGLTLLIREGFSLLGIHSFFTAGVQEVRSWTIKKGDLAPQAAGAIHTDFEKSFIRAEVISYQDYVDTGGEANAKEKGKMRVEGKDYVVADGDVIHFRVGQ